MEESIMYVPEEIEKILFTEEQLKEETARLGAELTREYSGRNPLFVCVLKGASVFFADLIRAVECPLEIDFFRAKSYLGTTTTGVVDVNESELPDIKGRDVVIVEDIVDTARTLSKVKEMFLEREPRSLKIVCLLDKPSRREVKGFTVDSRCFEIDDLFVVGYGLDCDQRFRNLPYIGVYKAL
ncbi:MAG: hypoxanthine phosphoribosyltransferase [Lachnospiraceae bacterium]|nr:hypoxanthine phosphoribosyltransferase [Ruminococcus sp.]MCM1273954.1 hypoxanthine phosphoribosyltransferase [Lachnospiraceae bacterium]